MRGLRKSKRVSWATDFNLCQIKLFLSEESPSQVGLATQDHIQAKASWLSPPTGIISDDVLPPGFEAGQTADQFQIKISDVPVIKWKRPLRLVIDVTWQVVAGEESKEVEDQNEREMRVLEAVYPHPSAIPLNPAFPATVDDSQQTDENAALIPITPIEDEDAADVPANPMGSSNVMISMQPQLQIPSITTAPNNSYNGTRGAVDVDPDLLDATSAAFSALSSNSSKQGTLIDNDLLVKILNNPKLIEKLVAGSGGAASHAANGPNSSASSIPVSNLQPPPQLDACWPQVNGTESCLRTLSVVSSGGPFYSRPEGVGQGNIPHTRALPQGPQSFSVPSFVPPQSRNMNYYKNLVQQHGAEKQDAPAQHYGNRHGHQQQGINQETVNPRSRDSKPKIMKPCIYFNSSRGCRNGVNCAFQHDPSLQQKDSHMSESQSAKRMKMDREISS